MINSMVEFLLYTQAVGGSNPSSSTLPPHSGKRGMERVRKDLHTPQVIPRSSNGKTAGSGPAYRSSNLWRGAQFGIV
jgi:hypothetical protein